MTASSMNSWIVCPKPNAQARVRLFCFPFAGGGASIYRTWPDGLPASIETCSVQLPGRESRLREPLFARLQPLVQSLTQILRPYLNMPYALFGHSLGALISFELARALVLQNHPGPVHLFVSGHAAPQIPDTHRPIHQLPDSEFIQELGHLNGTPREVLQNAELMALFLPVLRADFTLNETYRYLPGALLECPISAFGGWQDSMTSRDSLAAWREQTRNVFMLRMFPGDHFFLYSARTLLLRALARDLARFISNRLASN